MRPYIYLVDCSYLVFFTAFSTFKAFCRNYDIPNQQLSPTYDPTLDEQFCYMFNKNFQQNVLRPVRNIFPIIDPSKFIFCMDCPRKNIWRRQIYPEYKLNRDTKDKSKDKFDISRVFKYAYDVVIPNFCDTYNAKKIMCNCAQGDDIIAVASKYFTEKNKNLKVVIISCDRDMVQLYSENINIITADGKIRQPKLEMETTLKTTLENIQISANDFLLHKILLGDVADNIPTVKAGVGPKKAFNLILNKNLLIDLLKSDITIANSFKRNKQLISMNQIPSGVTQLIIEEIQQVFKQDK